MKKGLMFPKIRSWIVPDIGIDLRSVTPRVCVKGSGTMLEVPSALAINRVTKRVVDVGEKVERYLGRRAGNVVVVCPLKQGRIEDVEMATAFLRFCIEKVRPRQWWRRIIKPSIMVVVGGDVTGVERCAIEVAVRKAGAGDVYFAEAPMAAAVGTGLPKTESPDQLPALGWRSFALAIAVLLISLRLGWVAWAIVAAVVIGVLVGCWIIWKRDWLREIAW